MLNHDSGFVHRAEDFSWIEGAREAIARVNRAGLYAIVVTNQSGVARGYYTLDHVERLHAYMNEELAAFGARIDAFYACPYHHEGAVEAYIHADHPERKPNPGMLLRAISDFGVDPDRSLMIGDRETDVEAGRRAGVKSALFAGGSLDAFVARYLLEIAA